ncbi:MAG TPA: alpha/beta fold hydrolase [Acidimicrobiales bacterium]|nr:alpha/beta fold hydrolase [Acidimicrobiales bacterium]
MTVDVMPGCEPYSSPGGSMGVLVLHGFTGNPFSMRPLAERCAKAGYSVELPRLPGHGTSLEDLVTRRWPDFIDAAFGAFNELAERCEKVAVVGLSVGGGLSALIAEERTVAGCVFINPMLKGPGAEMEQGLRDLIEQGVEILPTDASSDIKKAGTTEAKYEGWPLRALQSVIDGVEVVAANLSAITAPSLLLSSREDHTVAPNNGDEIVEKSSGPVERIWLEESYHVATLDNDQELVESATLEFLAKVLR